MKDRLAYDQNSKTVYKCKPEIEVLPLVVL